MARTWTKHSAYNRGQILYRLAEMLESRAEELTASLSTTTGNYSTARREVETAIDRVVHYAGWTDKFESLLGSVNPVASPHFNFTVTEPMGIVNLLTGARADMLETFATHEHIRAIHADANPAERTAIQQGASTTLKRTALLPTESLCDWFCDTSAGLDQIRQFLEFKAVWHPIAS